MTPVDPTNTEETGRRKAVDASLRISRASVIPCEPVNALAFSTVHNNGLPGMLCELTTTQKDRSGHDAILREDSRHDPGVGGRQQGEVQQGRGFDAGMNPGGEKAVRGSDAACNLFHVHKESFYRLAACTFFPFPL